MQGYILVVFFFFVALTEGLFINRNKCPIKKYTANKYVMGHTLLGHEDFAKHIKTVEKTAKDCNVHVYVKDSYYQMIDSAAPASTSEENLVIGHGFRFEIHDTSNKVLCNAVCLSKNPMGTFQIKCFLETIQKHGLVWSIYDSDVISDGTYESDRRGYQALKVDIQTKCQKESFKRQLLRALRRMNEEESEEFAGDNQETEAINREESESDSQDTTDIVNDEKKK
ncbi:unnamed protein product [Rotaria sordida]|uniref:Uncharacterized protein n=2 Tax=Rotaria sordida TaxID=392033 RepID=A0A818Q201_9BILA|nr:unnamed protein product [Rotaria sordida]CAF3629584.1 unnamed protein product [Rotaria sordida]